jgi:ABC-type proline/glycine betaine transport system permease subunit
VLLFQGVITANYDKIVAGALAVIVLSFSANIAIRTMERRAEILIRGKS